MRRQCNLASGVIQWLPRGAETFRQDLEKLFEKKNLAEDSRFLRRVALSIKQLSYAANKSAQSALSQSLTHFLTTPWGAPFVGKVTLLEAADQFSEQEPKFSSLAELLEQFATFQKHMQPIVQHAVSDLEELG